jgi:hypothetical protein
LEKIQVVKSRIFELKIFMPEFFWLKIFSPGFLKVFMAGSSVDRVGLCEGV